VTGRTSVKLEAGPRRRKGYDAGVTRWLGAVLLVAALGAGSACEGDHGALAKRPTGGSGGGSAAGGSAGTASGGTSDGGAGAPTDGGSDGSVEPEGQSALTLVHGVVDAETIAFCFARASAGEPELIGSPVPKTGLAYGAALALAAVPGVDFAKDDVIAFVVATAPGSLSASSCAELIAQANVVPDAGAELDAAPADPAIRARALALIPSSTLSGGYSHLMVAAGCLGAPSHTDAQDQSVCGVGYAPWAPTLAPIVVQLSRITKADRLGLQVVHASTATESVNVRSVPEEQSLTAVQIAYDVPLGAIAPRPPNLAYGTVLFGTPIGPASIEIGSPAGSFAVQFSWASALSLAALGSVQDGRSYTLVLLGPRVILGQTGWWNPPAVTIVANDPAF
jgi:hypothetical protein